MALDKKDTSHIWETLMATARRHGPDPDDHKSAYRRVEREYYSICLIINGVLAKITTRPDGTIQPATSGRRFSGLHLLLSLITLLGITTTTLSWLSFQSAQIDVESRQLNLTRSSYLKAAHFGKAIAQSNKITIEKTPESFILNIDSDTSGKTTVTIPHDIPKGEYQKLFIKK